MFVTLEVWQRFGPKRPAELTPKVANIIPGSPIALEGMPPADELLAGIVFLSPALAGSLRDTVVAHVIGNMEDEDLNPRGIGYHTVFPSQRPAIFWLSLHEIVEATLWAQTGLRKKSVKEEGRREGTTLERMT